MNTSFRLALSVLTSVSLCGCFSYTIFLGMHPGGGEASSAGGPDVAAVVATVAEVARSFQFTPSPDLKRLQQQSEEADYWFYRIVADYRRSDEGTGYSLIFITVAVHKQTGEVAVQIRDLDRGWQSDFTRGLEEALVEALAARFPSDRIEVKRKWSGPHVFAP